jgi:DNA invertase Pin-like site-specific DNA recombinase
LADSKLGDVLLVEQVDRLSRLTDADWRELRAKLDIGQVRVVALDLPTSWHLAAPDDELTARMFAALNATKLDMLAAGLRRRQAQGIAKAKGQKKLWAARALSAVADRNHTKSRAQFLACTGSDPDPVTSPSCSRHQSSSSPSE